VVLQPSSQTYVKASNTGAGDIFGRSIALSADGSTLAVGAHGESSNATGVHTDNSGQSDDSASSSGAVYVFTRAGSTWTQQAYIKASNAAAGDYFGVSVSLSADGSTLAIGAVGEASSATGAHADNSGQSDNSAALSGAVYVFTRTGSAWAQQAYVKASNAGANDLFGYSVGLSADGSTLAVGARGEASSATGVHTDNVGQGDNSASSSGAVYVFTSTGSAWTQQAYIKASNAGANDLFGTSLGLSADGSTLAVGAYGEASNATGVHTDNSGQSDNSASSSGAVYVFARTASTWTQRAYVKASSAGAVFGISVGLSADGSTLAVGARGDASSATGVHPDNSGQSNNGATFSGAVYVFTCTNATWTQQAYVKASNTGANDLFGSSLRLSADGSTLAVGAIGESSSATGVHTDNSGQDDNSASGAGAVYVFARAGSTWTQHAYVKASNTDAHDEFGYSVALSADGSTLAVGADAEGSGATGVHTDNFGQADNSASSAGAVYVF